MANYPRVVITGSGAVCGSGNSAGAILDEIVAGRSAIAPIAQWDTTGWPVAVAAEVADFNPRALVEDRKLHKLIRRTDMDDAELARFLDADARKLGGVVRSIGKLE